MIPSASLSLSINQKFGRLGVEISKPKLEIRQPAATVEISQKAAQMNIDQALGKVDVDGQEARDALSHRTNLGLVTNVAEQTRQLVLEQIGAMAAEGDQLAAIEKGNTLEDVFTQRWEIGRSPIEDAGPFSYTPVRVNYTPHPTKIEWQLGGTEINPQTQSTAEVNYTPGAVKTYVDQQNWLQVDVKGNYLNMTF